MPKKNRVDQYPNSKRFLLELSSTNTPTTGTLELFEPVYLSNGKKVLVAEILSIILSDDIDAPESHQTFELQDAVSEAPIFSYRHGTLLNVGEDGTYQFDLTDGQGHGLIVTKNPTWLMQSTSFTKAASAMIQLFWRFIEISSEELVAMLAGGI